VKKLDQRGSHIVVVLIVIVVLAAVGFVGWRVVTKKDTKQNASTSSTPSSDTKIQAETSNVTWEWMGSEWKASGTPPACPKPLALSQSPTDVSKATNILYPGQARGGDYKPHGGFRFDNSINTEITIKIPMDAKLYEGSRYIEGGEAQYLLVFVNPCGLMYRFDHLLTLNDKFQKAVEATLPVAKPDDSRTTKFDPQISVTAGETVATAVGFSKTKNVAFDFGVYDLRQRNTAAQDSSYVSKHQNELSQVAYGVCWFELLPAKDADIVRSLPAGDSASGKTSDYCK